MNNKFLPGAVLFIITFVLSNLASLAHVKAQEYLLRRWSGHEYDDRL